MNLGLIDLAGLAGLGQDLPAFDLIAALGEQLFVVGVSGDPAVVMTHQDQVAVAFEFTAGVGNDTAFSGMNLGAQRNRQIDTVVVGAVGTRAKRANHFAFGRPAQLADGGGVTSVAGSGNLGAFIDGGDGGGNGSSGVWCVCPGGLGGGNRLVAIDQDGLRRRCDGTRRFCDHSRGNFDGRHGASGGHGGRSSRQARNGGRGNLEDGAGAHLANVADAIDSLQLGVRDLHLERERIQAVTLLDGVAAIILGNRFSRRRQRCGLGCARGCRGGNRVSRACQWLLAS